MPSNAAAVQVIKSMPDYVALFQTAFPKDKDPITYNNMALAIGAFERELVTPSRWDAFLEGDQVGPDGRRKIGLQHICRNRLPMVPLRSVFGWSVVPEARRCETVARPNRSGTLPGD